MRPFEIAQGCVRIVRLSELDARINSCHEADMLRHALTSLKLSCLLLKHVQVFIFFIRMFQAGARMCSDSQTIRTWREDQFMSCSWHAQTCFDFTKLSCLLLKHEQVFEKRMCSDSQLSEQCLRINSDHEGDMLGHALTLLNSASHYWSMVELF